jgi:hypothetical protein
VIAVGVLAAATGWVGVAWRITPWALEDQGLWRAAATLANAAAGLLVPLALLAVAQLAARPGVPATVAACLLLIGTSATPSRGGVLALAVGAAVLATLLGPGRTLRAAGPPTPGAVMALIGLAPPCRPGRRHGRRWPQPHSWWRARGRWRLPRAQPAVDPRTGGGRAGGHCSQRYGAEARAASAPYRG